MLCSIINDKTLVLCFVLFEIRCNIKLYYSAHKRTQNSRTYGGRGSSRPITALAFFDALLDFWRGARQVRRRLGPIYTSASNLRRSLCRDAQACAVTYVLVLEFCAHL